MDEYIVVTDTANVTPYTKAKLCLLNNRVTTARTYVAIAEGQYVAISALAEELNRNNDE